MSIFRGHAFGYNTTEKQEQEAYWRELRRRANDNLANPLRTKKTPATKDRRTELQKATPLEIQLGHDVLERRELNKVLNRLLLKRSLTPEEEGAAEELQHMIDQYDYGLSGYTNAELRRFVRLWNKSRKAKYRVLNYEDFTAARNKP